MRFPLTVACLLASVTAAGCSSSSDSGASDAFNPYDAPGCPDPNTVTPGGACDGTFVGCMTKQGCFACGYQSYLLTTQQCSCNVGHWQCAIYDCGPMAPGTYQDSSCTTQWPDPDASSDTPDALDSATDSPSDVADASDGA